MKAVIFACKEDLSFMCWDAGVPASDLVNLHVYSCCDRDLLTLHQRDRYFYLSEHKIYFPLFIKWMQLQEMLQAGWCALYRVVHRQLEMPYWCVLIRCIFSILSGPHSTQDACPWNLSDRGTHTLLFSQNIFHPSALCICSKAELLMAFEVDKGASFSLSD